MKKALIIISATAAVLLCPSCAKVDSLKTNDASKRYLDSWLKIYHPDAKEEASGIYLLEDTAGTGAALGEAENLPYIYCTCTRTDLDGNILETTDEKIAQQIGTYDETKYYGPIVKLRSTTGVTAGQEMVLSTMNVGGTRTAMVPGWFETYKRYKKTKDYFENETGSDAIYTISIVDAFKDVNKWQIDSIERYIAHNFPVKVDSTAYGYYYYQLQAPTTQEAFGTSDNVTINYTGGLLNKTIFDTTVENRAKDAGIYTKGKTYAPATVTLAEKYTEIKLSGSEVIEGFANCISKMKAGEKGIAIFISAYGYGGSAQGKIPAFSPLWFEIEMIGKKE